MRSQGWCGEARLQASEEVAVNRRLTKNGKVVSAVVSAYRDEVFRSSRRDDLMRRDGGSWGGDGREGEKVGKSASTRMFSVSFAH